MTRLPRTIRLDASDLSVFDRAAEPDEWAVPGSFSFLADSAPPQGKRRAALASGFLGTTSFGWATLVAVAEAAPDEVAAMTTRLAAHLRQAHGAPSAAEADAVARREVAFAASLCDHPPGTLLTLSRRFEGETLLEQFRTLTPDADGPDLLHRPIDLSLLAQTDV